jgi:hypothetical protein
MASRCIIAPRLVCCLLQAPAVLTGYNENEIWPLPRRQWRHRHAKKSGWLNFCIGEVGKQTGVVRHQSWLQQGVR